VTALSRRRFLGLAACLPVAAACSDGDSTTGSDPDLDTAARAAGIEKVAADTYAATGIQITQGRLGAAVPAAVAELLNTGVRQHLEHLHAWNKVLAAGGRPTVDTPDARLRPLVDAALGRLTDIPAAAALALRLEDYASRTYLRAIPGLRSPEAVTLAARILVVDQQRQAVLRYVLGLPPVGSGTARETIDFAPDNPNW
jgi:hypothetical protein